MSTISTASTAVTPHSHPCELCTNLTSATLCQICFQLEGLFLHDEYTSFVNTTTAAIEKAKAAINQAHVQYAQITPMIVEVLLQAKVTGDEEMHQEVMWRLGIESMLHDEAVAKEEDRIEGLEDEARRMKRRFEIGVRVLKLKRKNLVV